VQKVTPTSTNEAGSGSGYIGWWRVRINYWIDSGGATLTGTIYLTP
jgi:hypothetical protein